MLDIELEGLPLAEWDMRELRRRHAAELVAKMLTDQKRAPGGARNILRSLSAMTEDAITDEVCELNPWLRVKVRDDDRRATKHARRLWVWSFDEVHAFAAEAGRYEAMIRTLSDCGLRVGELFALQRAYADDGMLRIRGTAWEGRVLEGSREKTHNRDVPVPPGLRIALREMPVRIDSPLLVPLTAGKPVALLKLASARLAAHHRAGRDRSDAARIPPFLGHAPSCERRRSS